MVDTNKDKIYTVTTNTNLNARPMYGKSATLKVHPVCNGLNVIVNKCFASVDNNGLFFNVNLDLRNAEDATEETGPEIKEYADTLSMSITVPNTIHGNCSSGYDISNLLKGTVNGKLFYMKGDRDECALTPIDIYETSDLVNIAKWETDNYSSKGFTIYRICGKIKESACIDKLYISFSLPCEKISRMYGNDSENTECTNMCISYSVTHTVAEEYTPQSPVV